MSKPLTITIDIVSDTICPWCFIGKRRLEAAIKEFRTSSASHAKTQFAITWHPFYLGPPDGPIMSKMERYTQKFGAAKVHQMVPYMQTVGASSDITFDYGGPIGPTYVSHAAIGYVQRHEPDRADGVVEALFGAYFERQGNIFTKESVMEILRDAKVQLDYNALERHLDSREARAEVDGEVMAGQRKGISGVPDFTVGGERLNGAQEPGSFIAIFERLARQQQQQQH